MYIPIYIYIYIPIYIHIPIYICTHTYISRTVPTSVYESFSETNQQNQVVRYNSWLRWNSMNLRFQQTVTNFYPSDVRRPFRSQVQFVVVAAFCVHSVESVEDVWGKKNLIFMELGKVNFILLTEWQEKSYKSLRWSDISSNPSLKLFILYYLSANFL